MENTTLMPYRSAPPAIEPIDPSHIPDCGRSQMREIEKKIQDLHGECARIADEKWSPVLSGVFFSLLLALIYGVYRVWLVHGLLVVPFALMAGLIAPVLLVLGMDAMLVEQQKRVEERTRSSEFRALRERRESLECIERLTGGAARANELTKEIDGFNADLGKLKISDCSSAELEAIRLRRQAFIARISDFRKEALPSADEAATPLLTAPTDRT